MFCKDITFVPGGSIIFYCLEDENSKEEYLYGDIREFYSKFITSFRLCENFADKGKEDYGRYKMYNGLNSDNFKWVDDPKLLSELSEAIRGYIDRRGSENNWFNRSESMVKLVREESLFKFLEKEKI